MQILADADALPNMIKDILYRAAERLRVPLVMVANQLLKTPRSEYISSVAVPAGPDEADNRIVEMTQEGDLVVTADIPLAARVVEKGATGLNPRGELYTGGNVKQKLAMRDFMAMLRDSEVNTGGPSAYGQKDRRLFANALDRFLTKSIKPPLTAP